MNNNTNPSLPTLHSDGGGVLNSGKIKIQGTNGKSYNLDEFSTANSCPFPIGFGGFFQTDPSTIYSGTTWEQKKDVFILAAGTAYPAGSTGGEAKHVLTKDEMPSHYHDVYSEGSGTGIGTNRIEYNSWNTSSTKAPDGDSWGVKTMATGGSKAHNNMPPYFAMPFWVRTA